MAQEAEEKIPAQEDSRVSKALKEMDYKHEVTSLKNFRLVFPLPRERQQMVFIASQTVEYGSIEYRKVWSVAYKTKEKDLPQDLANQLLRLNVVSRIGAWEYSMREDANRLKYVVRIPANCSTEDLKSAINAALYVADQMEETLSKKDEF